MMNRYSVSVNSDPDNRISFFYWSDLVEYMRNEMESDGKTYRLKITDWQKMATKGKASCQMQWVRINSEGIAEIIARTVRCEDTQILPTETYTVGPHVRLVWARAKW